TAYKMNRLLKYNVMTSTHTASSYAQIQGWDIVGKTGTTDYDRDLWFVGASPYCTLAVWSGYDQPNTVNYYGLSAITWKKVMSNYLADKTYKEFTMPDTIIPATYCMGSGLLAASYCANTATGYYTADDMPAYCSGIHQAGVLGSGGNSISSTEAAYVAPSYAETPSYSDSPSTSETTSGDTPSESGGGETPSQSGGGETPSQSGGGEGDNNPDQNANAQEQSQR
ncbi:MAG: hypothetical protein IJI48_03100, partial [Ruminococcus sp.]|nr:hypothetical protein [Ruminococcus sp.]